MKNKTKIILALGLACKLCSCRPRQEQGRDSELDTAVAFTDETIDASDYFVTDRNIYDAAIAELKAYFDITDQHYGETSIKSLTDVGLKEKYSEELAKVLKGQTKWLDPKSLMLLFKRTPNQIFAQLAELQKIDTKDVWEAGEAHKLMRDVPLTELAFVRLYTTEIYSQINKALRSGDKTKYSQFKNTILTIGSGLNRMPHHLGVVARGLRIEPGDMPKFRERYNASEKNYITEWSFLSTSVGGKVASPFEGNVEFRIFSLSGTPIEKISDFQFEKEVLFPPGTDFYICSTEDTKASYGEIYLIKMVQRPLKKSDCEKLEQPGY